MRESDAFAWYMESDPALRSTIVAVAFFDRCPDWPRLVESMERASRLTPRFRQRVVVPPLRLANPRWEIDPDFDLSWHLRRIHAPAPYDRAQVLQMARRAAMDSFDRDRPLWELTLVEGLAGGEAATVMKVHHALTDGLGGNQLALLVFDRQREAPDAGPMPEPPAPPRDPAHPVVIEAMATILGKATRVVRAELGLPLLAARAACRPLGTASRAAALAASVYRMVRPMTDTLSPLMQQRGTVRQLATLEVSLVDLKAAAARVKGTVNDAFLAAVIGGLGQYHERHGVIVDALRVTTPISIRRPEDPIGGNRVTIQRLTVPVNVPDPAQRMRRLHQMISAARREPSLRVTNRIAGVLNVLPPTYLSGVLKHVDFLASNVPGLPFPVYLAGAEMTDYYGFGPTIGASVNITLMSYRGNCGIGVTIDTDAVPDPKVLVDCLRSGFAEIVAFGERTPTESPAEALST
jgi:WS/DGAT/MGAT family acyltransferase